MAESEPDIEGRIVARLTARGEFVATAESCSGGLIAHRLTNVPGASACFVGGVVAYSNEVKCAVLGVSRETLAAHGAVSEATAREMAIGARERFAADYALAVTGIAGPTGGAPEKPVGLVYAALATAEDVVVRRHDFEGDRDAVKRQTADAALELLWEALA
ncbi:MAG TPA: CinA family protein [Candidatus Hydrogenedentes bacterium]|nr:CinA family protein [Candidatus Hydrogenedentota bacterium]